MAAGSSVAVADIVEKDSRIRSLERGRKMKKIALLIIMGLAIACSDQSEQSAPATEVDKLPLVQLRIETPEGKDPVDASVEYSQGTVLSLMQAAREQKLSHFGRTDHPLSTDERAP